MTTLGFIQGIGSWEIFVIFVVVLLIFGPKSLPKLGRSLGQGIREFKNATTKMSESMMGEDEDEKPQARAREIAPPKESPPKDVQAEREKEKVG